MLSIHAKSPCALRTKLRDIDVSVPPRTEGRTTADCETWVSCHFLAAISKTALLDYPLCITSREKPDLVLSSPSERTGIEITEAVPENQAQVDAYIERNDIEDFIYVPLYPAGEENFSKQRIEKIAKNQDPSQRYPFMGDQIERNWVEVMLSITRKKVKKSPGYQKYDRNWLLIYDNWSPSADLDAYPDATTDLGGQLFNCDWKNPFDRVFILRSRHVWEFSCGEDAVKHATLDLWQVSDGWLKYWSGFVIFVFLWFPLPAI